MHKINRMFWDRCLKKYPRYFTNPAKIIEFGSKNINGSIRDQIKCHFHIGVDWQPGPYVDLISLAHKVSFADEFFDSVISASMFEHDPYWDKSLNNMIRLMKDDGILAISWGAALNGEHCLKTAPDGKFHALKAGYVLSFIQEKGLYIHEFQYERSLLLEDGREKLPPEPKGMGECILVAFKDRQWAFGKRLIDNLIKEDRI